MFVSKSVACLSLFLVGCTLAYPVTQPVYASPQYYTVAPQPQIQQAQYRQPLYYTAQQPQAHPVVEQTDPQQPQYVAQQAGPLNQPLLGTVDRQVYFYSYLFRKERIILRYIVSNICSLFSSTAKTRL